MRNLFLLIFFIVALFLCNCNMPGQNENEKIVDSAKEIKNDTFHLLCQYWQLEDAEHPSLKDVSFTNDEDILLKPGIVFMTDSVVLENPAGEMTYGKFNISGKSINVDFDDGRKAIYKIGRLYNNELWLKRIENKQTSQLTYKGSSTYWPDARENPFSKQNYQWSRKPKKPESEEALQKRVKENVRFYAYYIDGFINGGASEISFDALPGCLDFYSGGIFIQNKNKLDHKWVNCFYSEEQAFKGRDILENAITKKYDWDTTQTNWLKQTVPVLEQISASL